MQLNCHRRKSSTVYYLYSFQASLQFCNLAGPASTVMVGGFPLKGVYPIYPPSGKIRVAITVFTYSDQVHVTVVSHRSMPNFCQSLLTGMSQQVSCWISLFSNIRYVSFLCSFLRLDLMILSHSVRLFVRLLACFMRQ